eukprot:2421646-Rhodomonas_salina.2
MMWEGERRRKGNREGTYGEPSAIFQTRASEGQSIHSSQHVRTSPVVRAGSAFQRAHVRTGIRAATEQYSAAHTSVSTS